MSTHTSAKDKQSETKSSAWTFLLVGSGGFLIITLAIIGIIKLPLNMFALAVMEGMFLIFLVIAGLSFKKAMKMLELSLIHISILHKTDVCLLPGAQLQSGGQLPHNSMRRKEWKLLLLPDLLHKPHGAYRRYKTDYQGPASYVLPLPA